MTDRYAGYVVTMADDIREDDAQATISALRQIKGVISVEPILGGAQVSLPEMIARSRVKLEVMRTFHQWWDELFKQT